MVHDLVGDVVQVAGLEADLDGARIIADHIALQLLLRLAQLGAGGADQQVVAVHAELHRARPFAADAGHAADRLGEVLLRHAQHLVVAARDHALILREGAVDQLGGQLHRPQREADLGVGQRDGDLVLHLLRQLPQLVHRLAGDDHARHAGGAIGQRFFHPRQPVAVGRHRAQHLRAAAIRGVEVDAVQVVARLFRADREAGAVDQLPQLAGGQGEAVGQLPLGHRGEVIHRQHGELGVEAPGAQRHQRVAARVVQLELRRLRQLADDLIQRRGGGGGAALARHGDAGHFLDHRDLHVRRGQLQPAFARLQQDIGEDGDGVAPFHHALHMRERLEQHGPVHGEFHGTRRPDDWRRPGPRGSKPCRLPGRPRLAPDPPSDGWDTLPARSPE